MAEATSPQYDSAAVPLKASTDSTNAPAGRRRKGEVAAYAYGILCFTFGVNWMLMCPQDLCDALDIRMHVMWVLAQIVVLAVAASPLLEDRRFDHGGLYFVYQAVVLGTILCLPRPPVFQLPSIVAISSWIYKLSVYTLDDDCARTGSYGLFWISLEERFYRSFGAPEEFLNEIRGHRSRCEERMRKKRFTTEEALIEEKPSQSGSLPVEDK